MWEVVEIWLQGDNKIVVDLLLAPSPSFPLRTGDWEGKKVWEVSSKN